MFSLTPKQEEANRLLGSGAAHVMLRGGARSGKTFLLTRATVLRALRAPESRHGVFRLRFNAIKTSIGLDTFPSVMKKCFPTVPYDMSKTDWFAQFPNGSQVWLAGLDDKERTEKILGQEFATIYLNECSQISYASRNVVLTRLAQKTALTLRGYYDCNPPRKSHWTYRLFEQKIDPVSRLPLAQPARYASMMINPEHNRQNLAAEYIAELDSLPDRERRRFRDGIYADDVDGALWTEEDLERLNRAPAPRSEDERQVLISRMKRIVVAIDPSGCEGPDDFRSDEIGIVVAGQDAQGVNYILADLSGRYSPEGWARAALKGFDDWRADTIIGEANYGGAMVASTVRNVRPSAPFRRVNASRGKTVRAEPIAALYSQGKVKHAGYFAELEDQLCNFATSGYKGSRSPDRADAAIWAVVSLTGGQVVQMVMPIIAGGAPGPAHA
jgi:hypothetical protein